MGDMMRLKIKRGTIQLPVQLHNRWKDTEVTVHDYGDKIVMERPTRPQKMDLKAWEAARGILKRRVIPDPVAWQRKIRKEWERKLP